MDRLGTNLFRSLKLLSMLGVFAAFAAGQVTLNGTLADGTEAATYSGQITATGGTAPYHFSISAGSFLPVSLQLADDGTISGTLNAFGTFLFFIQATDSSASPQTGSKQFSLIAHQMVSAPLGFATTTLPTGVFGAPYSGQAQLTGGRPPYQITAPQNELPLTMSFNAGQFVTDNLSVPPGTYQFHVNAQDSTTPPQAIQGLFTFTVLPGVSVLSHALKNGTVLQAYSDQIAVSSGTPPFTFVLNSGTLPQGLQLNGSTGTVTGTPTHPGNSAFGVLVTDATSLTGSANFTIAVAGIPLSFNGPIPLLFSHVGVPYSPVAMSISGGVPPYTFALVSGGGIPPPGLSFNLPTGVLSGTPANGGNFGFEFEAIDAIGDTGFFNTSGTTLDLQPSTLPNGASGSAYQQAFSPVGFPTTAAVTLLSGLVPSGLVVSAIGPGFFALQGIPTATGTFNFTIRATDGAQLTQDRAYSLTIGPPVGPALGIIPAQLQSGTVNQPYSQSLGTLNSTPPVTFTKASGTLPPGLTLSSSGVVTGTPTNLGSYSFDVSATDSTGKTATASVTILIFGIPPTVSPATIPNGAANQNYSVTFSGSGGAPPYTYYMDLTPVPGLFLDANTGVLSGKPTSGGTYNIRINVQDSVLSVGSRTYALTITGATQAFVIEPPALNDGAVGHYYHEVVGAQGAAIPLQWAVTGGSIPPGLNLNPDFTGTFLTLIGILTTAGSYSFELTATDANGHSVSASYSVRATDQIIHVGPDSVPAGSVGAPYSVSFAATGGTPPYTFVAQDVFGTVDFAPAGLLISPNGTLSGFPLGSTGYFRIKATDSNGVSGSRDYQLVVTSSLIFIEPNGFPAGAIRQNYPPVMMTASKGVAPYTFTVTKGALPRGMTLSSAGSLSGVPQQAGLFEFGVTVQDLVGGTALKDYIFTIAGDPISLGPSTLPDALVNLPYFAQVTASGGTPPYTLTMASATLWSFGLNFGANGSISGMGPASVITLSFTIRAVDANGSVGTRDFQIITRASGLILSPSTLTSAITGAFYSKTFTASGGQVPYTFSLGSGSALPSGMNLSSGGLLAGTPATAGNYPFTVQVHDGANATGTLDYILTVLGATVSIITTSIPSGVQGAPITTALQANGGTGPYTWVVTGGALPGGLHLSSDGVLTGTPGVLGAFQFTVTVTDHVGQTDSRPLSLAINTSGPVINSVSPNPAVGSGGNQVVFINGSGFESGPSLKVRIMQPTGETDLQGAQVSVLSPNQLSITLNTGTAPSSWSVQVINPDGQTSNVAPLPIIAPLATTTFALPQFVFGGPWYTALYFSNTTDSPVSFTANFIGDDGAPLSVPLVGIGTVSSQAINLSPKSTVILEALNGAGSNSAQGWVEASLPTGVVGYAVFRQVVAGRFDQEAVVPLTPESSQIADLTYDDIQFTTAVAFLNPTNQSSTVAITVYGSDGSPLGSTQVALAPRSKQSADLKTLAGLGAIAGNRGRAVFTASVGAVSVLGLRFGGKAFTSIPVTHRPSGTQTSSSTSFALPQFVFGGAWYTGLYFSNTTDSPVSFPVNIIGNDGAALSAPLLGMGNVTSRMVSLDPGATAILEAPSNTGDPGEGWVHTTLPPGVLGYAVFRQSADGRADQEAVVPLTSESNQAADLVYDDVNFTTSVAFLNPSDQQVTATITTYTASGLQNGIAQVVLPPHSKRAIELKKQPGLEAIAGNRGWASFAVPNGAVSVLGLRFGGQAFTSIPVPHR